MLDQRPVVVGVDVEGSSAAVEWAVLDAKARGTSLTIVSAYSWWDTYRWFPWYGEPPYAERDRLQKAAEDAIEHYVRAAGKIAPDVTVNGVAIDGDTIPVLIAESSRSSSIVLGSRRLGAVGSIVLGSVGSAVAPRAHAPVVVVREPAGDAREHAQVVVGVDGSDSSSAPLKFGFDYASRHRLGLKAILCTAPDILATMQWRGEPPPSERAQAWLSEALAGWQEQYPDVALQSGVRRAHPVEGLVEESTAEALLVVGTRGRYALAGTLLGSVSQGVLHHAVCPVAVIPPQLS